MDRNATAKEKLENKPLFLSALEHLQKEPNDIMTREFVLLYLDDVCGSKLDEGTRNLYVHDPDFLRLVNNAWETGEIYSVIDGLKATETVPVYFDREHIGQREIQDATVRSWEEGYRGRAHTGFWETLCIRESKRASTEEKLKANANYILVVQSSGCGKSRMLDEVAKEHFVIPLNLRQGSDGFPPPDTQVVNYIKTATRQNAFTLFNAFIWAILDQAHNVVSDIHASISDSKSHYGVAAMFRSYMMEGQKYSAHGKNRKQFYDAVVKKALEIQDDTEAQHKSPLVASFGKVGSLEEKANHFLNLLRDMEPENLDYRGSSPSILLTFDEAHILGQQPQDALQGWSASQELCRALQSIAKTRMYAVFISTANKVQQFAPPGQEVSKRRRNEMLSQLTPYTALPFDQFVETIVEGQVSLDKVSQDRQIVQFGRPLFATRYVAGDQLVKDLIVPFAKEKLIGGREEAVILEPNEQLACLAARIPFTHDPASLRGEENQRVLVEKHMRLCAYIDPETFNSVTIAGSEPLLAEASRSFMSSGTFDPVIALRLHLTYSGLNKRNQQELVAILILILAYDKAAAASGARVITMESFMATLFPPSISEQILDSKPSESATVRQSLRTFRETFCETKIWFNHIIKVEDARVLRRNFLVGCIARGAAILYPNDYYHRYDILIPYCYTGHILARQNIGVIIIKTQSDVSYSTEISPSLFDAMDPFAENGIFVAEDGPPVPIVRMVFALASDRSAVVVLPARSPFQTLETPDANAKAFTTFDIWCAGAFRDTFAPIESDSAYQQLLKITGSDPEILDYADLPPLAQAALQSMYPMSQRADPHWT